MYRPLEIIISLSSYNSTCLWIFQEFSETWNETTIWGIQPWPCGSHAVRSLLALPIRSQCERVSVEKIISLQPPYTTVSKWHKTATQGIRIGIVVLYLQQATGIGPQIRELANGYYDPTPCATVSHKYCPPTQEFAPQEVIWLKDK